MPPGDPACTGRVLIVAPTVTVDGQRTRITFERFDLEAYQLFLRCKQLPEQQVSYDWERDVYEIDAPSRFAGILTGEGLRSRADSMDLAPHLFDYQAFTVRRAIDARRFAIWADTGLGKMAMLLEWARLVHQLTGERVLILEPLAVIAQVIEEARRFYGRELQVTHLTSRDALQAWCLGAGMATDDIAITNYEKFIPGVLPELRRIGGLVADESSLLKAGGGVIKWNLIKSARGIEYKLSCTATPAPNDQMEYASQASFLEKIRDGEEVLWTYFTRTKQGDWRVKPHARRDFYRFMAGWSLYMRDPSRFGFRDILRDLPEPLIREYPLQITEQQRLLMYRLTELKGGLFSDDRMGVQERVRLSQVAKGFLYEPGSGSQRFETVDSVKPQKVAELVADERAAGRQVLVWTSFDEEGRILSDLIGEEASTLDGKMSEAGRLAVLDGFRHGDVPVLISKPQLIGYGLNLQHCRAMVFSGFDDSFERMYQAVRRCYRFGQTETVHVHVPYVPELEGLVYSNIRRKETQFLADVAACEEAYREALAELYGTVAA